MNSNHSYYSILNNYSVDDVDVLAPSIHKIQTIIDTYYKSLKGSERVKKQDLKEFLITHTYIQNSAIKTALSEFTQASDSRYSSPASNKRYPKNSRVFPAIVALNSLYTAIQSGDRLEDVLYFMYTKGYFSDILNYVRKWDFGYEKPKQKQKHECKF